MSYAECFRNKWPNFGIVFYIIPRFGHLFLNTLYISVTCVRARVCVCDCVVACNCAIVCVQSLKCACQWNETKRNETVDSIEGKNSEEFFLMYDAPFAPIALRILLESLPKNIWRIGNRILMKYLRIKMFASFFRMLWQSSTILTLSIEFLWFHLNLTCFNQRRFYAFYTILAQFLFSFLNRKELIENRIV